MSASACRSSQKSDPDFCVALDCIALSAAVSILLGLAGGNCANSSLDCRMLPACGRIAAVLCENSLCLLLPPWKQSATVVVLFYVLGLWAFASMLPRLEYALLLKSVWYLWGLVLVLQVVRLLLRRLRDDDPGSHMLVFEEVPEAPFELLNLSGH
jgi:hypothetical protein